MTSNKRHLIESYIQSTVKKVLKEDVVPLSKEHLANISKWLTHSLNEEEWFDIRDIYNLDPTYKKRMQEISDKMENLSKQFISLAKKSGLKIH